MDAEVILCSLCSEVLTAEEADSTGRCRYCDASLRSAVESLPKIYEGEGYKNRYSFKMDIEFESVNLDTAIVEICDHLKAQVNGRGRTLDYEGSMELNHKKS